MKRSLLVLLAALIGVVVTARLGVWQLHRAAQKEALQRLFDERAALPELPSSALHDAAGQTGALQQRRIHLRGHWLNRFTVFLDNRQMNGRPGFFVVTPLQLADSGDAVLVQRGWVARDAAQRTRLPAIATPSGEVSVGGRIAPPPARLYEFAPSASGLIRQNLDIDAYSRETGLRLAPLSLLQDDAATGTDEALLRQWAPPAVDVHKHYGYAFQWFSLCAVLTGLYVWFQLVAPWLKNR